MSSREIEFLVKFWNLPGGATLVSELCLSMIYRRVWTIKKFKSTHLPYLSQAQMVQCNATIMALTQLGFKYRTFLDDGPPERDILERLSKLVANFRQNVRLHGSRIRAEDGYEPSDNETTRSIMTKISRGEGLSYIARYVTEMITTYVCYLEVIIVVVATMQHEGNAIPLNMHVLWGLVTELRSVMFNVMRMDDIENQYSDLLTISSKPLYMAVRKFHYLVETFHQNTQLTEPAGMPGLSLLQVLLESGTRVGIASTAMEEDGE